jgi:hypothetical protein
MQGLDVPSDNTMCLSCGLSPLAPRRPAVPAPPPEPIVRVGLSPAVPAAPAPPRAAVVVLVPPPPVEPDPVPAEPAESVEVAAAEPAPVDPATVGADEASIVDAAAVDVAAPVLAVPVVAAPVVPAPVDDGPPVPAWAVDDQMDGAVATSVVDASIDASPDAPADVEAPALPPADGAAEPVPATTLVADTSGLDATTDAARPDAARSDAARSDAAEWLAGWDGPAVVDEVPLTAGTCPHCGVPVGMAPPEPVDDGTIAVGFIGSGRGSRAAIVVAEATGGATLVTENGIVRKITGRQVRHFTPVRGLSALTNRIAAALVSLEHLPLPVLTGSEAARQTLVSNLVDGRVEVARRVASDLAAAGVAKPMALLPLSASEIAWWSALADIRVQRFDSAIEHLTGLPPGAYPSAVGLLVLCTAAPIAATSRRARSALERRLLAVDPRSALGGAAAVSGQRSPLIDWLERPEPFGAIVDIPVEVPSLAIGVLRALAGAGDRAEPLKLPSKLPASVIDDVVDQGFRIADESLRQLDRERVAYLAARTDPSTLTDEEVDLLDVEAERDRRTLLAGRIPDPTPERPDSPLIGAIRRLVASHKSSEVLRHAAGPMADSLAAFLAAPDAERLVPQITDDDSVWGLLERTITDEAFTWEPPTGSSARQFLTWAALRRCQRALWANDWHAALAIAKHALRLADHPRMRIEANNFIAVANWLLGKDQAARETLLNAIEDGESIDLRANLGIVNSTEAFAARRHPALILAIPTSADRSTAERAFAQRSRLARRDRDFPYTVDELIWALNQFEANLDDPAAPSMLLVPIDPVLLQAPTGTGLFRPAPVPLTRRTAPASPAEIGAIIADARSDALLHVLKGAGYDARRMMGAGRESTLPRPLSLDSYPHQRQTRLPQYLIGFLVVAAGSIAAAMFVHRHRTEQTAPTTTVEVTTTVEETTTIPPTDPPTTEPPLPGFGESIVVNGSKLTPHDPLTAYGHLCVLFDVSGTGPLGFVPQEVDLHYGARTSKADMGVTTGRGKNIPVFGETGFVQREICWIAPEDWKKNATDLVYRLGGKTYRWRIAEAP